ncbi:unnamed protein product [Pseudo-nitzschia multistriata]|uniref:Uncharacterized protein n=1 Tax=Pseudo-nitzschia multistriata TaxID=183589 RepID=A0A448ZN74_9STRA|nr:unnamed protein product [Pseudo-nitzschia multistriata]
MFRRRIPKTTDSDISIETGIVVEESNGHGRSGSSSVAGLKTFNRTRRSKMSSSLGSLPKNILCSSPSTTTVLAFFAAAWAFLLLRSYRGGITAAGNETWYPVPLIGFVRSELALGCFLVCWIPFWVLATGWTLAGLLLLSPLAMLICVLVMPGPLPIIFRTVRCCGILTAFLALLVFPFWKRPQAAVVVFLAIAVATPYLPEFAKPMFSAIPVEEIYEYVINYEPDIIEDVGASALEAGPLLDFVWENRNDWVKVSHGRALGYFVFGKNFNHDQRNQVINEYTLRSGFRSTSYRETWGESDYRLYFPQKRKEVSTKFRERFGSSLASIYARVLGVDPGFIVLGDTGTLAKQERMGFPAVKIVFPSLFWHWFNNPHTDNYLYQMDEIDGRQCDKDRQRTFLIPLTEPPGAGLYYWFGDGTRVDVDYKVGNVYSFEVSVLHAIRPFPYFEWSWGSMMDSRVTIQAFGIPCGDYWYITH